MNRLFIKRLFQMLFYAVPGLLILSCNAKISDKSDALLEKEAILNKQACDRGECPCTTAVGTIPHGSKVTTYSKESVGCQEGCGKYAEELLCTNGKLSKDTTGLFFKCNVEECPDCSLGKNLIHSGDTIDAYQTDSVSCDEACDDYKQRRTCRSGKLSGNDAYQFVSCRRKSCRCSLPDNSGFISVNGSATLYSTEHPACGTSCANSSQNRTCLSQVDSSGTETFSLNGDMAYQYRTCTDPTNCFCTLPNNLGVMASGETREVSTVESVSCGLDCHSKPYLTVKCDNGIFKNALNLSEVVDFSTTAKAIYKYECTVQTCASCPVPGTTTSVPHGENYHFAKTDSVGCNINCEYLDRMCSNGTFLGDANYSAPSCTQRACVCTIADVPGINVAVGSSWNFYSAATAQCGQNCSAISKAKICTETSSNGNYQYSFPGDAAFSHGECQPPTGCACGLPGGLGSIQDGTHVVLVSQSSVPCGTTCDSIPSLGLTCTNGFLYRTSDGTLVDTTAADFSFKYYCSHGTCTACTLPGYGNIANNTSRTLYSKSVLSCSDKLEELTSQFKCENGVLLRDGNQYNPASDPNAPAAWYTSYTVNCPGCPLPWGGSIIEGTTINAYKFFGTVINNCGRGCKMAQRTCTNGILTGDASYNMQACSNACNQEGGGAPPRGCLLPWQNSFVTPDSQILLCNKKKVCNESCQNHCKLGRCQMETGTFDLPLDYIYQSCTKACP